MRVLSVLYLVTFMVKNSEKKRECSASLWSKLMRAANCVRFCLNSLCLEVHEGCLPHD